MSRFTTLADMLLGILTPAANKIPYFTSATAAGSLDFLDEDNMVSNSATAIPSQQSVKAYVDAVTGTGSCVALNTTNISGTPATVDFTSIMSATYKAYRVVLEDVCPSTNDTAILMRVSGNNGSSWSSSSNQRTVGMSLAAGGSVTAVDSTATSLLVSNGGVSNTDNAGIFGEFFIIGDSTTPDMMTFRVACHNGSGAIRFFTGVHNWGSTGTAASFNAFQLFAASGNMERGRVTVYGYK